MSDKRKGPFDDLPNCHAVFKAKHLHALRGILDSARKRQLFRLPTGLFIEPAEKGVFLVATDGWSIGVIYEPEGYANKPFRALLPERFCARAAPATPLEVFSEGPAEIDLPEWAQPAEIRITPVCALILPEMNHPSIEDPETAPALACVQIETGNHWRVEDFRLQEDEKVPWRPQFSGPFGAHGSICITPRIPAVFDSLRDLSSERQNASFSVVFHENPGGPHIVRVNGSDGFVGAFMGQRFKKPDPMPEWLSWPPHGVKVDPESAHTPPETEASV